MERHVLFRCAGRIFALPLFAAREVTLPPRSFTAVPRGPAQLCGVMNLRGRIVTVIEFASLLGLTPAGAASDPGVKRVVVLEARRRDLGLHVDEVVGIAELAREGPPPGNSRVAAGLSRRGDSAVTLLAPEALLQEIDACFPAPAGRPA